MEEETATLGKGAEELQKLMGVSKYRTGKEDEDGKQYEKYWYPY